MEKLRVLLIGAAFSADLHSDGYSRLLDKVQIVGICDRAIHMHRLRRDGEHLRSLALPCMQLILGFDNAFCMKY